MSLTHVSKDKIEPETQVKCMFRKKTITRHCPFHYKHCLLTKRVSPHGALKYDVNQSIITYQLD